VSAAPPLAPACGPLCRSMPPLLAALAGALFGAGLLLGGMTQPARVLAFLDLTGPWDPSLAFVLGGAVAVHLAALRLLRGRAEPWFDLRFHLPARRQLDLGLLGGAALFGVGWGLGGFCPGPALVSAAAGSSAAALFVAAMIAGMLLQHRLRPS
jgi:uncharacterized membrane protein YedE/YeeE